MESSAEETERAGEAPVEAGGDKDPEQGLENLEASRARGKLSPDSPLFGGELNTSDTSVSEQSREQAYEASSDLYAMPKESTQLAVLRDLDGLLPAPDPERKVDDWGRSENVYSLIEPILNFYYHYWFRVKCEGIENLPTSGGALLVANHAGAIPPDALMIAQAIRNEHPSPRPLYMLGENWLKGYPIVGMFANKVGMVAAHPANAQRILRDEGRLALVFPEGEKGPRKVYWQRYRLRRFGRGGFVATALRAGVPIQPIAVVGSEEAMPIFAHVPLLQRLTGLIYNPLTHSLPHFGILGAAMYLPAKFRIHFLKPIALSQYGPEAAQDVALVQNLADEIRSKIHDELQSILGKRKSVWFG